MIALRITVICVAFVISSVTNLTSALAHSMDAEHQDAPCLPSDTLTQHVVVADIDYTNFMVRVHQQIQYTNHTGAVLEQLVLLTEPNLWPSSFFLNRIADDSSLLNFNQDGQWLRVNLSQPLEPDCETTITLDYTLVVPEVGLDMDAAKGYYGYTERQLNLGHWLATVAVYQDGDWVTHDISDVGETNVFEQADWDVTLTLPDPTEGIVMAVPGTQTHQNGSTSRYVLPAARDFSLSLSDPFNVAANETATGVTVELYTLNTGNPYGAAQQALISLSQSIDFYSETYGNYPYDRMLVVQGDFPDGMELTGLVFVGDRWFTRYDGGATNYLTLITVHEVAHQWWYASVGNDSALYPWMDEALATYSELLYYEHYYPDLTNWWWWFRVNNFNPLGYVDSNVYEFDTARPYINAVYLRGAHMLHDLRGNIGDDAFIQLLHAYAEAGRGRIMTPEAFWALLTPEQWALTEQTRSEYFRQPQILTERK